MNQQSSVFAQVGFDFLTDIDAESLKIADFALNIIMSLVFLL